MKPSRNISFTEKNWALPRFETPPSATRQEKQQKNINPNVIMLYPGDVISGTLYTVISISDRFHYIPPTAKKGGHSETLLNTCIEYSNSADLLIFNNGSDWLSEDFDKSQ